MTDEEFNQIMLNLSAKSFANNMCELEGAVIDALAVIAKTSNVPILGVIRLFIDSLNNSADLLEEQLKKVAEDKGLSEEVDELIEQLNRLHDKDENDDNDE